MKDTYNIIIKIIFVNILSISTIYAYTLNELLVNEVNIIQQSLPTKITKNLILSRVYAINNTLFYNMSLSSKKSKWENLRKNNNEYCINNYAKMRQTSKKEMLKTVCTKNKLREIIYLGANIHVEYITSDNYPLFDFDVQEQDCIKNNLIPNEIMIKDKTYLLKKAEFNQVLIPFVKTLSTEENARFVIELGNKLSEFYTNKYTFNKTRKFVRNLYIMLDVLTENKNVKLYLKDMVYLFTYIDLLNKNKIDKLFTKAKSHLDKLSYLQSINPYGMQKKYKNKFNKTIDFIKLFIKNMPTNQKNYKNKD